MNEVAGAYKFASVGELAETVTQLLALGLNYRTSVGGSPGVQQKTGVEQIEQLILQQARDYLSEVREGFALSVRTERVIRRSELRYLVDQVLLDWNSIWDELGLTEEAQSDRSSTAMSSHPSEQTEKSSPERIRHQLLAFGMAMTAFGHLPKLPAEKITFPHSYSTPATYADISAPDTPGEMLVRIEELEQMIWRLMTVDLQLLLNQRYGALRRTYGFFEASAHLAHWEAQRFGLKPKRSQISLL